MEREQLYERLKNETKVFENERIEVAFRAVDRKKFVGADYEIEAYEDYALPIGHDANIPQPTTTAFMFELLNIEEGNRVLLIGAGSGWSSAIASQLVGNEGIVDAVEIVPELVELSRKNLKAAGFENVVVHDASGELGLPEKEIYDRIIVFASSKELPQGLLPQLAVGGILVLPIEESLYKIFKTSDMDYDDESYPGFVFQPLLTK